jgi:hypothetical protein
MSGNTVMTQQVSKTEENFSDIKASGIGMSHFASILLLTESFMGPSSMKKKQDVSLEQGEVSDEEGCMSAEESTVAGTSSVDADCTLSQKSFSDTEELSDSEEDYHLERQSKALIDESSTDGFCLVARRIAGVFAALDDADSDEEELSAFVGLAKRRGLPALQIQCPRIGDDDEDIDVENWQEVGARLSSLSIWTVDSDCESDNEEADVANWQDIATRLSSLSIWTVDSDNED